MIDFGNAKILTYNHSHDFLGEAFRFASKKDLTIEGSIYNLNNFSGVSGVWTGIAGMELGNNDYDTILLNGVNFGSGRVNSITWKESDDVRKKDYTVSLSVFDTGNTFNLTGLYYSGINFNDVNSPSQLLESFSESFDFTIGADDKYTYRQVVNAKFISGSGIGITNNPISMARHFSSGLLFSTPAFGFIDAQHSGFYDFSNGRRTYTESYNLITNQCAFTENFELDPVVGNYSFRYNHELSTNENGITNVTENGTIKGLVADFYTSANAGYVAESANAFMRCDEVFTYHMGTNVYPLVNIHLSSTKKINKVIGEITYALSYTNNPNLNNLYIWEYTQTINRHSNDCFYDIKEAGKIKGISPCTQLDNYQQAQAGWVIISPGIATRASSFYNSTTSLTNAVKQVNGSENSSPWNGEISYDYVYTDDPYWVVDGFKKIDYTVENKNPVPRINKFNIINVKELVQPTLIAKEGTRTVTIRLNGERALPISTYLSKCKSILNTLIPNQSDVFISNCSYSFTPLENSFNLTLSWTFFKDWAFTQVLL